MSEESLDVYCPECTMHVSARIVASGNGGFSTSATNPIDEVDAEYHGDVYFVCLCRRCSHPFLVRRSLYGVPGEFETITSEEVLYPSEKKLPLDGAPANIKAAHQQAVRAFSAGLYEPCALMCRKCLEATCKALGATGRDLNKRLESLLQAGHIDARLLEWAHGIRLIGNEAAHDPDITVSKRDARDVLDLTESILMYVFSLSARFEKFKSRRAKNP